MVELLKENRRKIIMLAIIIIAGVFLITKPFNKEVRLDEVGIKEVEKNNMVAIMLNNGDGTYNESNDTKWPPLGYKYNSDLSGCVDYNGNKIEGILSYDDENHMATVESGATSQCFLYFDKITLMKALNTSTSYSTSVFGTYYNKIKNIYFVKYISENANKIKKWDLSDVDNGTEAESVIGWLENNTTSGYYDLYIGAKDTIYAKKLSYAFANFSVLETLNFDNLDTCETTDMRYMFSNASSLTSIGNISNWDTSKVTDMRYMFYKATGLISLNLSNWDTSKVINMNSMFQLTNITSIEGISNWDISSVTDMNRMFSSSIITNLEDISNWDTSSVIDMSYMFSGINITSLDLSNWDISKVTNMSSMFFNSSVISLDLSGWNTSSVTDMSHMFYNASKLTSLNLSEWTTSSVTDMSYMFSGASNLTSIEDISGWDTSNVTNMQLMFYNVSSLTSLDLSGWDTSSVTDMSGMFSGCTSLKILDMSNASFNQITNSSNCSEMFGASGGSFAKTRVPETIKITVKDSDQASWIRSRLNNSIGSGKGTIYLVDGTLYQ